MNNHRNADGDRPNRQRHSPNVDYDSDDDRYDARQDRRRDREFGGMDFLGGMGFAGFMPQFVNKKRELTMFRADKNDYIEMDHLKDKRSCCFGLFVELTQNEKVYVKNKISFDINKLLKAINKDVDAINIRLPKTPIIHYTNG